MSDRNAVESRRIALTSQRAEQTAKLSRIDAELTQIKRALGNRTGSALRHKQRRSELTDERAIAQAIVQQLNDQLSGIGKELDGLRPGTRTVTTIVETRQEPSCDLGLAGTYNARVIALRDRYLEVHRRLRRYHGVDWTWERFAAAHAEMVERGGLRLSTGSRGGYKVASWDVVATLAQAVAA